MFSFPLMAISDQEQVMHWRSSERIGRFMQTEITADLQQQLEWFAQAEVDTSSLHWMIAANQQKIGVLNLANINVEQAYASWGFYIGDNEALNLGGLVPPYLYNFVFNHTCLTRLIADVLETNEMVQKLHRLHGYEDHGLLPEPVVKGSDKIGFRRFILNKATWCSKKRFAKYTTEFSLPANSILS